jgi:hypothetical protein
VRRCVWIRVQPFVRRGFPAQRPDRSHCGRTPSKARGLFGNTGDGFLHGVVRDFAQENALRANLPGRRLQDCERVYGFGYARGYARGPRRLSARPGGWRTVEYVDVSHRPRAGWRERIRRTSGDMPRPARTLDFDVFLVYASEDKADVARPLAAELQQRGLRVWFDESELRIGDNLQHRIDDGLRRAKAAVPVISPAFFSKSWPQRELDAFLTREAEESALLILPVWYKVSAEDVARYSPVMANRLSASTTAGIPAVADQLTRALLCRLELVQPGPQATAIDAAGRPLGLGTADRTRFDLKVANFSDEVLKDLADNPARLYELSPRRFEELVAELYTRAGFEVELTPASRDGGVDVYAIRRDDLGSTLIVVQAKRYKPELKVGLAHVRELYGTVNLQEASAGVLITTSTFERGAEKLAAQHRWRLELRDYVRLQAMLRAAPRRA